MLSFPIGWLQDYTSPPCLQDMYAFMHMLWSKPLSPVCTWVVGSHFVALWVCVIYHGTIRLWSLGNLILAPAAAAVGVTILFPCDFMSGHDWWCFPAKHRMKCINVGELPVMLTDAYSSVTYSVETKTVLVRLRLLSSVPACYGTWPQSPHTFRGR